MKIKILNIISIVVFTLISFACVETLTNNPNEKPTISITSPVSGDTVQVGNNLIEYSASDYSGGSGLSQYEIFLNGESIGTTPQESDGSNPDLYLVIGDELLGERISYGITVYNQSGKYAQATTQTNLYVSLIVDPPEKIENLSISIIDDNEIILFWVDSTESADSYEVWRKVEDQAFVKVSTINAGTGFNYSYRDLGLSPFIVYTYKVRGVNEIGPAEFSNEVNTLNGGAPSSLVATANGATVVSLSWTDNALDENGFFIERMVAGGTFEQIALIGPNQESYIDRSVVGLTTYRYRVGAIMDNAVAYSNEASVTTAISDIPPPSSLIATYIPFDKAVKVEWTDNTLSESGTLIERKDDITNEYHQIGNVATDITEFYDYNIKDENIYTYRARHRTTESFLTEYSNEDTAYISVNPPNPPTNLVITTISATDFVLDWQDNSTDEDGFEVWAKPDISGTYSLYKSYAANVVAANVTFANSSIEYFIKVRATNASMESAFSNEVSTKGTSSGILLSLNGSPTVSGVSIRWNDPHDSELLYIVERKKTSFPADSVFVEIGRTPSLTGTGLIQAYTDANGLVALEQYTYRVRAKFSTGYSNYSNELPVSIP